jgi:hypothetical protein
MKGEKTMEQDKTYDGTVTVTIDGQDSMQFMIHSFYDILEAFMEQGF